MVFLSRQDLGLNPPSCDVSRLNDRLQVIRKVLQQRRMLVWFEKTFSTIVLPQQRDFRAQRHFACSRPQSESTPQCRELPVNRGGRGAIVLSPVDISRYSVARNVDGELVSEKVSKMAEATSNALQTAATAGLVVCDENAREVFERCALHVGSDGFSLRDGP